MAAVAGTMPTHGTVGKLLSFISAPRYLASAENRWAEVFFPCLPRWAVVDTGPELRWFYEGLPAGEAVPWAAWLMPVVWWTAFLGAAWFAGFCIIAILRRQWMDNERLAYPLAEMASALIRGCDPAEPRPRFARTRAFWVGFLLAFGTLAWSFAGYFTENWPSIPSELPYVTVARDFPGVPLVLHWPMLCIAFFLNARLTFSFWVFIVPGVIEEGVLNRLGFSIRNSLSVPCFDASRPALAWQSYGAMLVMVGTCLWVARRHLLAVLRKALRPSDPCLDDRHELLSARVAVGGLAFAACFMTLWLWRLGMRPGTALLFLGAAFVGSIALSRMVVEGGLVFILPPLTPQSATVTLLGNAAMGPQQLTAVGLTMGWIADPINDLMPAAANAAKVSHSTRVGGRRVLPAMALAVAVGFAVTVPFTLWIGYQHGAFTTGTRLFNSAPWIPYDYITRAIRSEPGVEWAKLLCAGAGGSPMLVLTALHHRLCWWPLHPLGLVVGMILKVPWCFLPFLAGWLCKTVLLRVGGAAALRRAKPFFLGAMVGWFAGVGVSMAVDALFFPGQGHVLCWH